MAAEIKRLVAFSGGMLKWGDFAILLRYNSMSRVIESMLQKEGIPNRVLSGHRFFERMEVRDNVSSTPHVAHVHDRLRISLHTFSLLIILLSSLRSTGS